MGAAPRPEEAEDDDQDAAVVLVSHSLARWVDDEEFLTGLVGSAGFARDKGRIVTVLAAAVHAIPATDARQRKYACGEGVSILRGSVHRMLADVFPTTEEPGPTAAATGGGGAVVAADERFGVPALRFEVPPVVRLGQRMSVHLPLANTLFATGKPVAIAAGRWTIDRPGGNFKRIGKQILGEQGFLTTRLIPLTPARPIARSFGNILSQVTVEGKPKPASKELESVIPTLIEKRKASFEVQKAKLRYRAEDQDHLDLKVDVWAMITPAADQPEVGSVADVPVLETLDWKKGEHSFEREAALAWEVSDAMPSHLARGARLFKVLSGGGGWGDKQGLLSLDPNTSLSQTDDQSFESFIASFHSNTSTTSSSTPQNNNYALPPGSTVQFLTPAHFPIHTNPLGRNHKIRTQLSIVFGTDHLQPHQALTDAAARGTDPSKPPAYDINQGAASVEDYPGRFGGVASPLGVHHVSNDGVDSEKGSENGGEGNYGGMYIGASPLREGEGEAVEPFKVDAPGTYVATRSLDRPKREGETEDRDEWRDD
ncbi:uncharacterized protein C8A04DRAFT_10576 [Dichotomopilus funicola]|uniref:Uncharacterized protein n=1 Tax=Dichotomopilus funicola TaxID=1934379 RepID=A0AAN6V8H1_9PEZI|nr:hypothetical protein C8A04DRAFT_10576 [Dichotomopilus funicola]